MRGSFGCTGSEKVRLRLGKGQGQQSVLGTGREELRQGLGRRVRSPGVSLGEASCLPPWQLPCAQVSSSPLLPGRVGERPYPVRSSPATETG